MNAEYVRERNRFTRATAGFLALAQTGGLLTLIRSDEIQLLGGTIMFVSALCTLVAYVAACKYFAMARGHADAWILVPLCIVPVVVGGLAYFFLDNAAGIQVGTIVGQAIPPIVLAIGAIPLWLLPDRTRRVDSPENTP